jgi:hypothetical protein
MFDTSRFKFGNRRCRGICYRMGQVIYSIKLIMDYNGNKRNFKFIKYENFLLDSQGDTQGKAYSQHYLFK